MHHRPLKSITNPESSNHLQFFSWWDPLRAPKKNTAQPSNPITCCQKIKIRSHLTAGVPCFPFKLLTSNRHRCSLLCGAHYQSSRHHLLAFWNIHTAISILASPQPLAHLWPLMCNSICSKRRRLSWLKADANLEINNQAFLAISARSTIHHLVHLSCYRHFEHRSRKPRIPELSDNLYSKVQRHDGLMQSSKHFSGSAYSENQAYECDMSSLIPQTSEQTSGTNLSPSVNCQLSAISRRNIRSKWSPMIISE